VSHGTLHDSAGAPVNFFERQHAARGSTVKLVVLFVLAVLTIVVVIDLLVAILARNEPVSSVVGFVIAASIGTLLVISLGTLTKMIALRGGGAAVAQSVGAVPVDPTTSDPQLRRFVNVVEEMSIASGVPVPRMFVLEQEDGINAFAAGYSPSDAAITVTGGALQRLNRDELQGVIGHEFSHVLNGDMRLNVRLIGLLNGILLLGLVGLRFLQFGGGRSDRKGGNPLAVIAIALLVLGFVGQFFAGLIQAAVSRQREWLADASSVQFTRQTSGLVGALKKIAGVPQGSALRNAHAQKQINHMLFGDGAKGISRLYATHPPLVERIRALDPAFDPSALQGDRSDADGMAEDAALGFASSPPAPPTPMRVVPDAVSARVATFSPADLDRGREISAQLPPQARQLASQPSTAAPLVLALLLDGRDDVRTRQLGLVAQRLGPAVASAGGQLSGVAVAVPPLLRLPLVALAAPVLASAPAAQRDALVDSLHALAAADQSITLFEYCLTRLVASYLRDAGDPAGRSRPGRADLSRVQPAALTLLAVVAAAGNDDQRAAEHAFAAAAGHLVPGAPPPTYAVPADCAAALDPGWDALDALDPRYKQRLVEAIVLAIRDDGVVQVAEAELLRTACALLHCPLPALLG
jgi:Zn-dependent protease with chaperone function